MFHDGSPTVNATEAPRAMLTSLLVQLLQDFADDLSHALQSLNVVFCAIKLPCQVLDLYPQVLQLGLPLARLDELRSVRVEGRLALFLRRHGRGF